MTSSERSNDLSERPSRRRGVAVLHPLRGKAVKRKQVIGFSEIEIMEIAALARRRSAAAGDPRKDRGYWWACYCDVCCRLRKVL